MAHRIPAPPRDGESGLALVATLWIMAVLSVLATEYLYVVHLDTRMARNVVDRTQLELAAKAGLAQFQRVPTRTLLPSRGPRVAPLHWPQFGGYTASRQSVG